MNGLLSNAVPTPTKLDAWVGDAALRYLLRLIVSYEYPAMSIRDMDARVELCVRNSALGRYANNNLIRGHFNQSPTVVEAHIHDLLLLSLQQAMELVHDIFATDPNRIALDKANKIVPAFQKSKL